MEMIHSSKILRAHSCARDARKAVQELKASLFQSVATLELVIFFCSSEYDLDLLAEEMTLQFAGVQVVGCTSAGEIGPLGYCQHSLTGLGFPAGSCAAVSCVLSSLQQFDSVAGYQFTQSLLQKLEARAPQANTENCFALLLVDGMSVREEQVAHTFQQSLGRIPLVGGSAADDQQYTGTFVYSDQAFHADSALLILLHTMLPFKTFMTHHFVSNPDRLVVTEADTRKRIIKEINGLPAAEEYARMAGVVVSELTPSLLAATPLVVKLGGTDYVRSIQKVNADGSLTFFCAIEEGVVFRLGNSVNLHHNLLQKFEAIQAQLGEPQVVIGFDCIQRNLEVSQLGVKDQIGQIYQQNNTVGFSCYGEQFHGVHVNQTFTGVAIGDSIEIQGHD